jgi:hypothetical protein
MVDSILVAEFVDQEPVYVLAGPLVEPPVAEPQQVEVQPSGPHHTPQSLQPHLATSPDR